MYLFIFKGQIPDLSKISGKTFKTVKNGAYPLENIRHISNQYVESFVKGKLIRNLIEQNDVNTFKFNSLIKILKFISLKYSRVF